MCYFFIFGWYVNKVNFIGKRSIVFNFKEVFVDCFVELFCGKCIGCKVD